jgi:hypothetical protein
MLRRGVLAVGLVLVWTGCAGSAWAQAESRVNNDDGPPITFYADLSADEESAVTESPGTGHVAFTLDRKTLRLSWKLTYTALTSPPTSASIHGPQTPGGNAGVVVDLAPKGVKNPLEGSTILTEGALEYLLTGRLYVNVFTTKYKEGELRGQIMRRRPDQQKPRS